MNNNEIVMHLEDYKTILAHNGRIDGIVGTCKINEFNKNFELIKHSIKNAKGIIIKFGIHKKQSLFIINSCVGEICDLSNTECDIIFGTEIDNSIDIEILKYEIIVTGL